LNTASHHRRLAARRPIQVLAKHPKYLNRFYKEESQFTLTWRNHGAQDTRETVSTTQVRATAAGRGGGARASRGV
jgi:hypothetical protein